MAGERQRTTRVVIVGGGNARLDDRGGDRAIAAASR